MIPWQRDEDMELNNPPNKQIDVCGVHIRLTAQTSLHDISPPNMLLVGSHEINLFRTNFSSSSH